MDKLSDRYFMQQAIEQAQSGKTPFGCVIVKEGEFVAQAFNTVSSSHDASAHEEINAIRAASKQLQSHLLSGCTLYTSGEPCPMCMSAIIYAKVSRVVFGASIAIITRFMPQISITSAEVISRSGQKVSLVGPFMEEDCLKLLQAFS
ncbi:MAG: nucleoside deaminase [Bacteroidota bacterium]